MINIYGNVYNSAINTVADATQNVKTLQHNS